MTGQGRSDWCRLHVYNLWQIVDICQSNITPKGLQKMCLTNIVSVFQKYRYFFLNNNNSINSKIEKYVERERERDRLERVGTDLSLNFRYHWIDWNEIWKVAST